MFYFLLVKLTHTETEFFFKKQCFKTFLNLKLKTLLKVMTDNTFSLDCLLKNTG